MKTSEMENPHEAPSLFPMKAHYFLYYSGTAGVLLFLPTYARQLGFSSIHVGSIFTILPIVSMLSKLTFGSIADKFQCHKLLLFCCVSMAGAMLYTLRFIPPSNTRVMAHLACSNSGFHAKICSPDTREDRCLVSNIQAESGSSNMYCSMECTAEPNVLTELCTLLQIDSKNCHLMNRASSTNGSVVYDNKYGYNVNQTGEIGSTREVSSIVIDSLLSVLNITEVDECLLFPINKIRNEETVAGWQEPFCDSLQTKCYIFCNSSLLMNTGEMYDANSPNVNKQYWMLLIILIASYIGLGPISCIGDTITYSLLANSKSSYGRIRMWGSLGWGIMAILSGVMVDNFSEDENEKNYLPIFYAIIFFIMNDLLMISYAEDIKKVKSKTMLDFRKILTNLKVLIFIFWVSCIGFLLTIVNSFLFWHMKDLAECADQEWITSLNGMYVTVCCLFGEVPFFFLNKIIMKRLGFKSIMTLLLTMLGLMYFMFSLIENPWWFVPIGALHGFIYSTYYSTVTSYASFVSTPGTEASMQALFASSYEGLGGTSGNFVAGLLFYYMDRKTVFLSYSCGSFILAFVFMCTNYLFSRRNKDIIKKEASEI